MMCPFPISFRHVAPILVEFRARTNQPNVGGTRYVGMCCTHNTHHTHKERAVSTHLILDFRTNATADPLPGEVGATKRGGGVGIDHDSLVLAGGMSTVAYPPHTVAGARARLAPRHHLGALFRHRVVVRVLS